MNAKYNEYYAFALSFDTIFILRYSVLLLPTTCQPLLKTLYIIPQNLYCIIIHGLVYSSSYTQIWFQHYSYIIPAFLQGIGVIIMDYRIETDFIGDRKIPVDAYYGINAIRGHENFDISTDKADHTLIKTMAWVKKACALANFDSGKMEKEMAHAISDACDGLATGKYDDQFIVNPIQGGAGTSFNMNANEVIANIVLEMLGHRKGEYEIVDPLMHINLSQSTNDVYPTAISLALVLKLEPFLKSLCAARDSLLAKSLDLESAMKMGRTHLNAAVPMSFGQSFNAYAALLTRDNDRVSAAMDGLRRVPLGGTIIGTEYKTTPEYRKAVIDRLREISCLSIEVCANLADGIQNVDVYSDLSATLRTCALNLSKIASDLRLLGSDRGYGIGELTLSPRQLGSSIIVTKINPVMAELINQVAFLVCGYDQSISMAANAGQLELNVFKPIIVYSLFRSIDIMASALDKFNEYCLQAEIIVHNRGRE